jgi:ABC-2 type transport system permease protein
MIRLFGNELTRYRSRRVIGLLILVAVLSAAGVAALTAWESRPLSKTEIATAQVRAGEETDRADIQADLNKCLADPAQYLGPGATQQECRDTLVPAPTSYLPREPLDLRGTLRGNGIGLVLLVAALLIIGASAFAGGDFASGSISNQVLFAPDRGRLWAAKALAVGAWSTLVSAITLGGFWVALYLVADERNLAHGSAIVNDIGWHLVRAVLFCAGAAVGAFALTTLFRHAVGTLGLLFAYSVGGEVVLALLPSDRIARWTLGNNVFGWLETRLQYLGTRRCDLDQCPGSHHLSHLDSGIYLLVLFAIAILTGLLTFRRRDL